MSRAARLMPGAANNVEEANVEACQPEIEGCQANVEGCGANIKGCKADVKGCSACAMGIMFQPHLFFFLGIVQDVLHDHT